MQFSSNVLKGSTQIIAKAICDTKFAAILMGPTVLSVPPTAAEVNEIMNKSKGLFPWWLRSFPWVLPGQAPKHVLHSHAWDGNSRLKAQSAIRKSNCKIDT